MTRKHDKDELSVDTKAIKDEIKWTCRECGKPCWNRSGYYRHWAKMHNPKVVTRRAPPQYPKDRSTKIIRANERTLRDALSSAFTNPRIEGIAFYDAMLMIRSVHYAGQTNPTWRVSVEFDAETTARAFYESLMTQFRKERQRAKLEHERFEARVQTIAQSVQQPAAPSDRRVARRRG